MKIVMILITMMLLSKKEFDNIYLVDKTSELKGLVMTQSKSIVDKPLLYYKYKTKYGYYIQLENMIIADGPKGKVYYAFDEETKKGIKYLPDNVAFDPTAPGKDKRMSVPESCIRCHEKKK